MSMVARKVVASPVRTASEAWTVIVDILSKEGSSGRKGLEAVTGVACSLITDECFKNSPALVSGSGPQVGIYCIYDEDAIDGGRANENPLSFDPTGGDWHMSLPCREEDLEWVKNALLEKSLRITAYNKDDNETGDRESSESANGHQVEIDKEAFLNL